ncbi:hypothetical protein K439DRAFT_1622614 [Ramaria rubella]|nr:hypothetical protein K439DRAFT_1622614 [Ramaria rubella]
MCITKYKKIVELGKIEAGDAHKAWLDDEFDYPKQDDTEATLSPPVTLEEKESHMNSIQKYQKQLLDGNNIESDEDMEEESYEIDKIVGHKSDKNGIRHFLVKWKGYRRPSWIPREGFNNTDCIDEYWKNVKAGTI